MSILIELFAGLGPVWCWLLLGALLLGLEIVMPGVHFVWFGVSAIAVSIVVYATGVAWGWQLIAFASIAAVCVMLLRGYANPMRLQSDEPELNARGQQYVGRTAVVEDAITGGRGKIRIGDTTWTATGPDTPAGASVRVSGVDGIVLVISPV